jgi:hypothetical protein
MYSGMSKAPQALLALALSACVTSKPAGPPAATVDWPGACEEAVRRYENTRTEHALNAAAGAEEQEVPYAGMPPPTPELLAPLADCAKKLPARPLFVLVPGFDTSRLAWGLSLDAIQAMGLGLSRGRTTSSGVTAPFNALAFVVGDKAHIVFSDALVPIDVWTARPDGRYVATVQHLGATYSGAIVPYYLKAPWVSVFDTSTLTALTLPIPLEQEEFSPQSVSLAWEGDTLWVLARDTWNRSGDERQEWRCTLPSGPCAAQQRGAFPAKGAYVEATASGGYRVDPLPEGLVLPRGADRRSIRASPSGKRVAWVHEEVLDAEYLMMERILFVRTAGKDVEVARGKSKLHAVWLDEDRLLFEEEPAPTMRWNSVYVAPEPPSREELLALIPPSTEPKYVEYYVESQALKTLAEKVMQAQVAALEALPKGIHPRELQVETLSVFDARTGARAPFTPLEHARIFAQPRAANLRGRNVNVEVPPLDAPRDRDGYLE